MEFFQDSFDRLNLLRPATGLPVIGPFRDIALGCYLLTKIATQGEAVAVLERLDQLVEREIIAIGGPGGVVVGFMAQAATADFAVWCGQCTAQAAQRWQARQVSGAGRTEKLY